MTQKHTSPFEQVVDLIGEDYVPVNLQLLEKVNEFYIHAGVNLPTFGKIFESLLFLAMHGVIEIIAQDDGKSYLVRSIYGKNNQQS